jgi:hypothetical protein
MDMCAVGDEFILTQLMTCTNRLNNFGYPFPQMQENEFNSRSFSRYFSVTNPQENVA